MSGVFSAFAAARVGRSLDPTPPGSRPSQSSRVARWPRSSGGFCVRSLWGDPTPEGFQALIAEMCRQGPQQSVWRHGINSVTWKPRTSDQPPPTSRVSSSRATASTTAKPGLGLVLQRRTVGMVLLEESFLTLIRQGCPSARIVALVSDMLDVGMVPDSALATVLLEEMWERGDQHQVVKMLVLMHRGPVSNRAPAAPSAQQRALENFDAPRGGCAPSEVGDVAGRFLSLPRVPAGLELRMPPGRSLEVDGGVVDSKASQSVQNTLELLSAKACAEATRFPVLPGKAVDSREMDGLGVPSKGTDIPFSDEDEELEEIESCAPEGGIAVVADVSDLHEPEHHPVPDISLCHGRGEGGVRAVTAEQECPSAAEVLQQKTEGGREVGGRLGRLKEEVRRRVLGEVVAAQRERSEQAEVMGLAGNGQEAGQVPGHLPGSRGEQSRVGVGLLSATESSGAGTVQQVGSWHDEEVDLALFVVRCALERGQFRAALALPRRLRQEGVPLSVDVYDAAIMAVVKEQELMTTVEQELKEVQSMARVGRLSAVDDLIVQVYGETIRSEGEHLLSWAMDEIQSWRKPVVPYRPEAEDLGQEGGGRQDPEAQQQDALVSHNHGRVSVDKVGGSSAGVLLPERGVFVNESTSSVSRAEGRPGSMREGERVEGDECVSVEVRMERELDAAAAEATLHEKMLALWCLAGCSEKAERSMWAIFAAGRPLSGEVVAAVLGTCSFKGDVEAVHRVLSKMEVMGHKPDGAIFSLIVAAALRGGHLQAAAAAMLAMVEKNLSPDRNQMSTLLRLLQRDGHVESYLILSSALSGGGYIGPCLVYFYLDFIKFCIIRML